MSLIFLSSHDSRYSSGDNNPNKPYQFSNFFPIPLKIPPNAQIALVNGKFTIDHTGFTVADEPVYCCIGDSPLDMIYPVYFDQNIGNWIEFLNSLGKDLSQYQPNSNFDWTQLFANVVYGGQSQWDTPNRGFVGYEDSDAKANMRVTQHNVVFDNFNQYFNCCAANTVPRLYISGHTQPPGITQGGYSPTTSIDFKDNGFDRTDLTGVSANATELGLPSNQGNPQAATGSYLWTNQGNFYNVNFAWNDATNSITNHLGDASLPHSAGGGQYPISLDYMWAMQSTRCGIQRNVGTETPQLVNNLVGAGHQAIGHVGSGGYNILSFTSNRKAPDMDSFYTNGYTGGFRGFTGIYPCFFGVHMQDILYRNKINSNSDSLKTFLENVDLNSGSVNTSKPFERDSAYSRYLFGVKAYLDVGLRTLSMQAQVLDPNTVINGSTISNSRYVDVGNALNISLLSQGINTAVSPPFTFAPAWAGAAYHPINTDNGSGQTTQLFFRFRWVTPYCMTCEFILRDTGTPTSYRVETDEPYLPADQNPTPNNPLTGWCTLYNMYTQDLVNENNYLIPTYLGSMNMVMYTNYENSGMGTKGYYFPKNDFRGGFSSSTPLGTAGTVWDPDNVNQKMFRDLDYWKPNSLLPPVSAASYLNHTILSRGNYYTSLKLLNYETDFPGWSPALLGSDGRAKQEIRIVLGEVGDLYLDRWVDINGALNFNEGDLKKLGLGKQLKWSSYSEWFIELNPDIDNTGDDYVTYGIDGTDVIINGADFLENHIQITNLPIQSKQGQKSTEYKCIYTVNLVEDDSQTEQELVSVYAFRVPQLIWIDINNYEAQEINRLDVLITKDNNKVQHYLEYDTSINVIIRGKPKSEEGYLPNNIPVRVS